MLYGRWEETGEPVGNIVSLMLSSVWLSKFYVKTLDSSVVECEHLHREILVQRERFVIRFILWCSEAPLSSVSGNSLSLRVGYKD